MSAASALRPLIPARPGTYHRFGPARQYAKLRNRKCGTSKSFMNAIRDENRTGGFYKRGCQEKTLLPLLENRSLSDIQPLSLSLAAEVRSSLVVFISVLRRRSIAEAAQAWRWPLANHGSIGDSRRGAALWLCWVVRGSIWWPVRLGAGGARSLTRPGYLPSNPSAQPEP